MYNKQYTLLLNQHNGDDEPQDPFSCPVWQANFQGTDKDTLKT